MSISVFKKYIMSAFIILVVSLGLEVFVFNFSSWRTVGESEIVVAQNVDVKADSSFDTTSYVLSGDLKNVRVDIDVENSDLAYASVLMTDEGDKYEYSTPEFTVCDEVVRSSYSNVYSFGKVNTVRVHVRLPEGCSGHINSISLNAHKPVDLKGNRFWLVFTVIYLTYLLWIDSFLHEIIFDHKKKWQNIVTLFVIVLLLLLGNSVNQSDKVLMGNPWPHHLQYQELARSLEKGTVVLTEQEVSDGLLNAENPYDTIALQVEETPYSMDYAYFNGNYYVYFGIVPELLLYYPFHLLTGGNLPNYRAIYAFYVLFTFGVFLTVAGFIRRFAKRTPYIFYILISTCAVLCANFVYLVQRPDIYNVPIMGAIAFSFVGIGLWLEALNADKLWVKRTCMALGSLSMALVVGCRPQFALLSFVAIVLFMVKDTEGKRELFERDRIVESACFVAPYVLVATLVCWYNAARFGSIFDFGAAYSLTSNDMSHRGFNLDRLLRSLYYYLLQPAVVNSDFPFLQKSNVESGYMGKFLFEHTYGGILVTNAFLIPLWIMVIKGVKNVDKNVRRMVIFFAAAALIVAGFDANAAGVIYRYTCDFAPAFVLAGILMWLVMLDRDGKFMNYRVASRVAQVAFVLALSYSFLTFVASGNKICLQNNNTVLFYEIADYFSF